MNRRIDELRGGRDQQTGVVSWMVVGDCVTSCWSQQLLGNVARQPNLRDLAAPFRLTHSNEPRPHMSLLLHTQILQRGLICPLYDWVIFLHAVSSSRCYRFPFKTPLRLVCATEHSLQRTVVECYPVGFYRCCSHSAWRMSPHNCPSALSQALSRHWWAVIRSSLNGKRRAHSPINFFNPVSRTWSKSISSLLCGLQPISGHRHAKREG